MPFQPIPNTSFVSTVPRSNDPERDSQWGLDENGIGLERAKSFFAAKGLTPPDPSITVALVDGLPSAEYLKIPDMPAVHAKYFNQSLDQEAEKSYPSFRFEDGRNHALECASVIGAVSNNGEGMAGIANVRIQYAAVTNHGASGSDLLNALRWLGGLNTSNPNPADVINVSLNHNASAPFNCDPALQDTFLALSQKGIFVVAAAGNEFEQVPTNCSEHVIIAGATGQQGSKTDFSDSGERVDTYAPGQGIWVNKPLPFKPPIQKTEEPKSGGLSGGAKAGIAVAAVAAVAAVVSVGGFLVIAHKKASKALNQATGPLRIEAAPARSPEEQV
jgi:hypothetical protein